MAAFAPKADMRLVSYDQRRHDNLMGDYTGQDALERAEQDCVSPSVPPTAGAEPQVEIHKPKPVHSWRELLSEVGVIVFGVLIALSAEQLVEAYHWQEKVHVADAAMTAEVNVALVNAVELDQRKRCSALQRIAFIKALSRKDWTTAAEIRAAPKFSARHFWSDDAYQAAIAGQISDHFDPARLAAFAGIYTMIRKVRQNQENGWATDSVAAMLTIPSLPKTDEVMLDQLRAAAQLNESVAAMERQGSLLQAAAKTHLGLTATTHDLMRKPGARDDLAECSADAKTLAKI